VDKISFYLSRNDLKRGKITLNVILLMSVQGSLRQSKAEIQADKNCLSQTCLSVLEIFWYLWYPGDPPRDAESLGRSLYLWGAVLQLKRSGRIGKALPSMCVLVIKPDKEGNPHQAKSRIVVLGNHKD
jgi:hypothetical protein